jgi:shikimate dehydrogenase
MNDSERTVTGRTKLAVVIGDPVQQSLSPVIHNAGFAASRLDWTYAALRVPSESLDAFVSLVRTSSISGVSVTMPHKSAVATLVDRLDESASSLASVNTIVKSDDGELIGYSTDGDGLCDSLVEAGVSIEGRSIVDALARHGVGSLLIHNRTLANAELLLPLARGRGAVCDGNELADAVRSSDIVINASSVGMGENVSPLRDGLLTADHVVVDIVYHPLKTTLLAQAESAGSRTVDGLRMLIHQAARQQSLWTGVRPDVTSMTRAAIRALG